MNYLLPGFESINRIESILSLTRIRSPEVIAALKLYYTTSLPAERCTTRHKIELSNFVRNQKKLEKTAAVIESVKAMDWQKQMAKLSAAESRISELEDLVIRAADYLNASGINASLEAEMYKIIHRESAL